MDGPPRYNQGRCGQQCAASCSFSDPWSIEMRSKKLTVSKAQKAHKLLIRCLARLRSSAIFVEGQKDRRALQKLGCMRVYTVAGNLALSCAKAASQGTEEVVILTDFDRRGKEMVKRAKEELERYGIRGESETRKNISKVLHVKHFENIDKAYEEFMKQNPR